MPPDPELSETPDFQKFNWKTPDADGQYPSHLKLHGQWEEEMERLKAKYNLDCFSESELDSELDEGEEYKYEHHYETPSKILKTIMPYQKTY